MEMEAEYVPVSLSDCTRCRLVSWLITRFMNGVPGCWNRVTRIRLYSISFFLNSCLLNWFLMHAPNVVGLHFPHAECGSGYV